MKTGTNHVVPNLLPTFYTPFNEYLRERREVGRRKVTKFLKDCATRMSISDIEGVSKEEAIRIRTLPLRT